MDANTLVEMPPLIATVEPSAMTRLKIPPAWSELGLGPEGLVAPVRIMGELVLPAVILS